MVLLAGSVLAQEEEKNVVQAGKQVSFTYTLSMDDGTVIESSNDQEPLTFTQGGGQILPALESELEGLSVGDEKSVHLAAEDAYGNVSDEAFQEVPIDQIPEDAREVGALLQAPGVQSVIRVSEVREDVIVLDFNHPLAGKALNFDITIVGLE